MDEIFAREKIKFSYYDPRIFLKSEWQRCPGPSLYYLAYRWISAVYLIFTWILSMVDPNNRDCDWKCKLKWLIYITDWSYTAILIQSIVVALGLMNWMTCYQPNCFCCNDQCIFSYYKLYWITNVLATDLAVSVSVIYWTLVYDSTYMMIDFVNISIHSLNSLVMLLDLFIVAHPIYFTQCYVTLIFLAIYTVFTYIYHLCGGTNHKNFKYIYKILDWTYPKTCFIVILNLTVVVIMMHGGVCILQMIRSLLGSIFNGTTDDKELMYKFLP